MSQDILNVSVSDSKLSAMIADNDVYRSTAVLDVYVVEQGSGKESQERESVKGFYFEAEGVHNFAFRDMNDQYKYTVVDAMSLTNEPKVNGLAKPEDYNATISVNKESEVKKVEDLVQSRAENHKEYRKAFDQIGGAYQRMSQHINLPDLKMPSHLGRLAQAGKIDVIAMNHISNRMSALADNVVNIAELNGTEKLRDAFKLSEDVVSLSPEGPSIFRLKEGLSRAEMVLEHGVSLNMYYENDSLSLDIRDSRNELIFHVESEQLDLYVEETEGVVEGLLDDEVDVTIRTYQVTTDEPIAWKIPESSPPVLKSLLYELNEGVSGKPVAFIVKAEIERDNEQMYDYVSSITTEDHLNELKSRGYNALDISNAKFTGDSRSITELFHESSSHMTALLAKAVNYKGNDKALSKTPELSM
jgi:hypothetical protein